MMDDIKKKEDKYKQEIFNLNNIIDKLKKEKESNIDIIRQNKELKEKNNNLAGVILGLRNNIKNIENDKNICNCIINKTFCNCCHDEYILYDVCCDCHCVRELNCSSKINEKDKNY